jgi:hypothetical protein
VPFKVGQFAKSTGAATVAQAVTGVGFRPSLVILWTAGETADATFQADNHQAIGATSGASESGAISQSVRDNTSATVAGHTAARVAAKALTLVHHDQTLRAECDLTSFDSDGFTLSWTTNNAVATIVHYLALRDVRAKVHNFQLNTATGVQAITGIGFQPELVIFLGPISGGAAAIPSVVTHSYWGLGAIDAAGEQFALTGIAVDTSQTRSRYLTASSSFRGLNEFNAVYVSMDADGYTFNLTENSSLSAARMIGVAIRGCRVKIGTFAKATGGAPASQSVSGMVFAPGALVLVSNQHTPLDNNDGLRRGGFGAAAAGAGAESAAWALDAAATTNADKYGRTGRVFTKVNNATPAVDAEASLTSFDPSGFTLSWNPNDAVATQLAYVALGMPLRGSRVRLGGRRPSIGRARGARRHRLG